MKVKNNWFDMLADALCLAMLAGVTVWIWQIWADIPPQVPTHYNALGEADGWGSKNMVIVFLVISWLMYVIISATEFFPQAWNTGVQVTEANRDRVYRTLKYMMKTTKLLTVGLFVFLLMSTAQTWDSLGEWFLSVFLLVLFGQMVFWIIRLNKVK